MCLLCRKRRGPSPGPLAPGDVCIRKNISSCLKDGGALWGASWKCPETFRKIRRHQGKGERRDPGGPAQSQGSQSPHSVLSQWAYGWQNLRSNASMEDWVLSLGFAGKGLNVFFGAPSANNGPEPERTSFAHKWDGVDLPDFEVPRALPGLWEAREDHGELRELCEFSLSDRW